MSRFGWFPESPSKLSVDKKRSDSMAVAYVQIEGVPGESTNTKHPDWIEVQDLKHSLQQRGGQTAGSGAMVQGRAAGSPYKFWKKIDKSSPVLMEKCLAGEHLSKVEVHLVRVENGENLTYMDVNLEDAIINEVEANVNAQGDVGEWVSLLPQKIKWVYTAYKQGKANGNTPAGWDYSTDQKYT